MNPGETRIELRATSPIPLNIDFSCSNGEIFVIVGPSGSGKTTILRTIAGLYKPDTGKIICQGKSWFDADKNIDISVQQRASGIVFQNYALFPHLTVRENIELPITNKDKSARKTRVNDLIEMVHLHALDDRYPHQISGGQQQRVAVARALARNPDILLLDEPFSSVDQQTRRFLVRELVQLKEKLNIPIIHVTHDLNEARRIADTLCIIHEGAGLQIDSPETVMSMPKSSRVASLTGHDNVYQGRIIRHDSDNRLTYIRWQGKTLSASHSPEFEISEIIDWFIPSSQVIACNDNNDSSTQDNRLEGKILETIQLGEGTIVSIGFDGLQESIQMNYSTHDVKQYQLQPGKKITVSLIADGIHIMKSGL